MNGLKQTAVAYLKNGDSLPIKYMVSPVGTLIDFTIEIDGEEIDFMLCLQNDEKHRWLERDLEKERRLNESGCYKKARFDFDRLEFYTVLN